MRTVKAAAIYARISSDQTGEGLGVARQLEDCRKLATERGWTVAAEYVDNDISAFRGKARLEYARMLADIEAGRVDAVIAYHQDRLTRRPMEWEQFVELCDRAGVEQLATVTSDIDFGNDNGMLVARITAAVAANESARKSARIQRKIQQNVEQGKPNGGAQRPFGYESDKVTVRESEAQTIRTLVARFLAGESLRSLVSWMNDQEIPTTGKAQAWRTPTLRQILAGGRIAGLRDHHGVPAGPAAWEAIITREQHEQILALMKSKQRTGQRARTYREIADQFDPDVAVPPRLLDQAAFDVPADREMRVQPMVGLVPHRNPRIRQRSPVQPVAEVAEEHAQVSAQRRRFMVA